MSVTESGDDISTEMVSLEVNPAKWHQVGDGDPEKVSVTPTKQREESTTKCNSHPLIHGSNDERIWDQGVTYFNDGVRSIDFVLAWSSKYSIGNDQPSIDKRTTYETNLTKEGLHLESDVDEKSGLTFVKIHVPRDVMIRYAEILKFRQPIRRELCTDFTSDDNKSIVKNHMVFDEGPILTQEFQDAALELKARWKRLYWWKLKRHKEEHQDETKKSRAKRALDLIGHNKNRIQGFLNRHIYIDKTYFPPVGFRFSTTFSSDKMYLFDLNEDDFFSPTSRSRVAHFVLSRIQFDETTDLDPHAFGIDRLINLGVYLAAYPLHDGDYNTRGTMRNALLTEWGSLKRFYRYQPLDYVKEYFGVKVALYFCWLGFYTCMLFPAAIVGIIVFLSGFVHAERSAISAEVCAANDVWMCPLCDKFCSFWTLDTSCTYSTVLSFFDNGGTAFFAAFMSIWAVLFLELWKRYAAEVTHRWDLTGYDMHEEVPRPQYLAKVDRYHKARKKLNKVTGAEEKRLPFWTVKFPITFFSFSVVFLLVFLALVAAVGVIVYRMAMITASAIYGVETLGQFSAHALLFINITAGFINLITLMMLTWLYDWIAKSLTEFEMNRTQSEFDDSLTFKMYLLQFINYYTSIFYLAFIKGKYTGYPGDYSRILGIRQEECDTGGCLFEVTAQLAIVMVGKQIIGSILEIITPMLKYHVRKVMKAYRRGFMSMFAKRETNDKQWVKDYYLEELDIFYEYLEMVLQYGFVTIFVSAFPLAPLCALINNLFESRIDARKFLISYRRPVAIRVKGIGVWLTILDFVSKFAVFSNALIIAFTSEFIPHLVYRLTESPDWSLRGYTNYSLSYMNVTELDRLESTPLDSNVTICRYKDYRHPPWEDNKYTYTTTYWTVLAARLIFMVLFENIVIFLVLIIAWAIPDVPVKLKEKIRRETYIINNIIIDQARNSNKRQGEPKKSRHVHMSPPPHVMHEVEKDLKSRKPKKSKLETLPKIEESFHSLVGEEDKHGEGGKKPKKRKKVGQIGVENPQIPSVPPQRKIPGHEQSPGRESSPHVEDPPRRKKTVRTSHHQGEKSPDHEDPPKKKKKMTRSSNPEINENPDPSTSGPPPPQKRKQHK